MPAIDRFLNLFRRERLEADVDEELAFHIESRIQDNRAAGMTAEEARRDAERRFGGLLRTREAVHDADVFGWIEAMVRDAHYAVRSLRRSPTATLVVVASLALAIGANTAMFSLLNAVVFRPLPYRDPARLAMVWTANRLNGALEQNTSLPNLDDWRARSRAFEELATCREADGPLMQRGDPSADVEWIGYAWMSANAFSLLGRGPKAGRALDARDIDAGNRVAVIGDRLWQRRFGGARSALGRTVNIGGIDVEIVGVMADDFRFPSEDVQLWLPATLNPRWSASQADRGTRFGAVVGRLREGATLAQAQAEMRGIAADLERAYPDTNANLGVNVVPLQLQINGTAVPFMLALLFGAVLCVLLIACANAACLLLARSLARARELAVRSALGAGRGRLVRQLLTESVLLSCLAGGAGLLMAAALIRLLLVLAPANIPRLDETRIDRVVLLFTASLSVLTGVLFGLAPALRASRDSAAWLPGSSRNAAGGRSTRTLRHGFVVCQFALALVLLSASGLMLRSLGAVRSVDTGFGDSGVVTARLRFHNALTRAQRVALYGEALERVRELPGVRAAGGVATMFWTNGGGKFGLRAVEGQPDMPREQWDALTWTTVSGDYFQALGVPLLRGRFFHREDTFDAPRVVLINETMARRYWPGADPIGRHLKGFDPRGRNDEWLTVIGVVRDVRSGGLERVPMAQVFEPQLQSMDETENLVVATAASAGMAAALHDAIRALDRTATLTDVGTLQGRLDAQGTQRRFETYVLGAFALLALALAATGIFGMMHYAVAQRRQEMGIRIAIGARPVDVMTMLLREGAALVAAGTAIGGVAAVVLMQALSGLLFGVTPTDPATFAIVCAALGVVALVGCSVPAIRAARVDPLEVLSAD